MTIPHIKRSLNRRIREKLSKPPDDRPARPPASMPPPAGPRGSAATLALAVLVGLLTFNPVDAQTGYYTATEDFEDATAFSSVPNTIYYTHTNFGIIAPTPSGFPEEGDQSVLLSRTGSGESTHMFNSNFCGQGVDAANNGGFMEAWIYIDQIPSSASGLGFTEIMTISGNNLVGSTTFRSAGFEIDETGTVSIRTRFNTNAPSSSTSILPFMTATADTWYNFIITCGLTATFYESTTNTVGQLPFSVNGGNINKLTLGSGTSPGDTVISFSYDNLAFPTNIQNFPPITTTQTNVVGLNGYGMDAQGNILITRESNGAVVRTYNANDLTSPIATTTTPNCARPDAVVATVYDGEIWTTHGDCDGTGDIDALRIRNEALGVPTFPNDCEGEPTEDVENNADIDVPNNLQQVGTLGDLTFDFRECINPTGPGRGAFASWTFSSSFDGWIAAFGVGYGQDSAGFDEETSHEEHATPPLDQSTAGSKVVDDFCSWVGSDGKDYVGGVSSNGAAGVYEITREIDLNDAAPVNWGEIDFTFIQRFRNSGTYGGSTGIACAQDKVAIATPGNIRVLENITGIPTSAPGWPLTVSGLTNRPLAMTGSGEYLAVATSSGVIIYDINGTRTSPLIPLPTGTFRGMEFSFSGDKLALFGSTQIVVALSSSATCSLDDNCEELGGVGDDEPGPVDPNQTPTGTGGPDFGANIEDNVYFWVIMWVLIGTILTAGLSVASRGGFGGQVYLMVALGIYIIAILLNNFDGGNTTVSPWPVAAIVATSIGFGITTWVRR